MSARKFVVGWGLALLLMGLAPTFVAAQGTVTGRVTEGNTLRPLAGAQVSIPGTGIGALANNEGRFLLVNVPVGAHDVKVEIIGFTTQTKSVTVTQGQTVQAEFQLQTQALGLDEIIVTGTAGGQTRRAIGNVIGQLNTAQTLEQSAPASVSQMLAGRVAGVMINVGGGNVGSSGAIKIRGTHSLSLGGNPLIYVNGVRYNGSGNRLQDINPEDIERFEVIKGPAAATLYGTEASNGVVQIITKKGGAGTATLETFMRQGANWFQNPDGRIPNNFGLLNGQIVEQDIYADEIAAGRPMFRTGKIQEYGMSVRGGRDNLSYFASGSYNDEEGYMLSNGESKVSLRTNVQVTAAKNFDVSADIGVIRSNQLVQPDGTSGTTGVFSMLLWGNPLTKDTPARGFMVGPPEVNYDIDQREADNRATTSVTLTHRPMKWLTQRVVGGFDFTDEQNTTFYPLLPPGSLAFYGGNSTGAKTNNQQRTLNQTFDYNITANFNVQPRITSATSFGAQYFTRSSVSTGSSSTQMPTAAVSTVTAGAQKNASETISDNKTFGVFVQQTFGWHDQAFVTAAVRADANSAFGESFNAAYYPKLSGTWVISDRFSLPVVQSMKLRAAFGKSGQQPNSNSKFKTYTPTTGPGDAPAVTPGTVGNPDLKPEVGSELELGFDASAFSDRVTLEVTHYRQKMTDVILTTRVAPSLGFASNQDVNAGTVKNNGWEITLNTRPIVTQKIEFGTTATAAWTKNTIVSMGGKNPQADTRGRWQHIEGYPLGESWSKYVASAEYATPGKGGALKNVKCYMGATPGLKNAPKSDLGKYGTGACADAPFFDYGRPDPGFTGSLTNNLTLGNALTLSAFWMVVLDSRRFNTTEWYRDNTQRNSEDWQKFQLGTLDPVTAAEMFSAFVPDVEHRWFERDDFIKLREVSAAYNLPSSLIGRMGFARGSIVVTGRNMLTWVDPFVDLGANGEPKFRASGLDPETKENRSSPWPGWQQTRSPIPNSIITSLRLTF